MARDAQRAKVYAWERVAYPNLFTADMLTRQEVIELVREIHRDVRAAGGDTCDPSALVIKFTMRRGGACATWGWLNFTAGRTSRALVIHECAHSLTHGASANTSARDLQGHGPQYVACYVTLMERYGGFPAEAALQTARLFSYEAWGPKVREYIPGSGGRSYIWHRERVKRHASVSVSNSALAYWRGLFNHPKA